jgi:hypothetical protein
MVNDVKNHSKKDSKKFDVVGEFSFFLSHNGGNRS